MSGRVVFWDFDGTLARREDQWTGALLDAAAREGTTVSAADVKPHLSAGFPWHEPSIVRSPMSGPEWWTALHPVLIRAYTNAGVTRATAESAALRVPEEFYRLDAWSVIGGAADALSATQSFGYRNVILSNHPPELPALVEALGLGPLINGTITSASVGAEKPNPAIFDYALRFAGVSAGDDVWMVGDNPIADVAGARAAGLRAVLADGDYPDSVGATVLEAASFITGYPSAFGLRPVSQPPER